MLNYRAIKSNDRGVWVYDESRSKSRGGEKKAANRLVIQTVSHSMAQLLKLNIMWDKILKHIQDRVGAGSLFGANY